MKIEFTAIIIAILLIILGIMIHREYISTNKKENLDSIPNPTPVSEVKSLTSTNPMPELKVIPDPNRISNDVPFNAYIPMESPPDPRYQFVPDVNAYLLPYQYLNFALPFDRWMYYHFPSYYAPYYPYDYTPDMWPDRTYPLSEYDYFNYTFINGNNIYGDNYLFSNYAPNGPDVASISRSKPRTGYSGRGIRSHPLNRLNEVNKLPYEVTTEPSKIIGPIPTLSVDTDEYPTEFSGFAGGYNSQLFTDGMAYASGLTVGRGLMGGFGESIDNSRSRGLNYADRKTAQSYTKGGGRRPQRSTSNLIKSGNRSLAKLKNKKPIAEHFNTSGMESDSTIVSIPSNAAFYPLHQYVINEPGNLDLTVRAVNKLDPAIPYTDGLYQASDQWVNDSRANDRTVLHPPISVVNPPDLMLNNEFNFAREKTTRTNIPTTGPYANPSNNLFIQYNKPPFQSTNPLAPDYRSPYYYPDNYLENYQATPDSDPGTNVQNMRSILFQDPYPYSMMTLPQDKAEFDFVNKYNMGKYRVSPPVVENYQAIPDSDPGTNVQNMHSILYPDPYLKERDGNNVLQNQAEFNFVNKYNEGLTRPIGSNLLGRGWGYVTGLDERLRAYSAKSDFNSKGTVVINK